MCSSPQVRDGRGELVWDVGEAGEDGRLELLQEAGQVTLLANAVFPGGSDLMNTSRISDLLGQEGPKTVFIGPV